MVNVEKKLEDGTLFVSVEGRLDTFSSPAFEEELRPAMEDAEQVILDFEKVEYISSAGLRVLLAAEQDLEDRGLDPLRILNPNDEVRDVFNITGFTGIVKVD